MKKVSQLPIIKKYWEVFSYQITYDGTIETVKEYYFADSASKAKVNFSYYTIFKECSFIDIKAIRAPHGDIVLWNGAEIKRIEITRIEEVKLAKAKAEKEKIIFQDKLNALPSDEYFYVQDTRSYHGNSVVWYGKNNHGYTSCIENAHLYSKEELIKQFNPPRENDRIWLASHVMNHIVKVIDSQYLDRKFAI